MKTALLSVGTEILMGQITNTNSVYLSKELNDLGLATHMPKGAFYVFPDIRGTRMSSDDFAMKLLKDYKVACVPGTAFGACGEGFLRMSYATSYQNIVLATNRLRKMMSAIKD
jgi:aminotransferase